MKTGQILNESKSFFQAAAGAILIHHLPSWPKICFDDYPLSFLLAFIDEIQEWSRFLLYHGEFVTCLQKIELMAFMDQPRQPDTKSFLDSLEILFSFGDKEILEKIGWDRERFHRDKCRGLGRLVLPKHYSNAFPKEIKWHESYVSIVEQR